MSDYRDLDQERWRERDNDDRLPQARSERYEDEDEEYEDDHGKEARSLTGPTSEDRNMAMLCHLGGIMGFVIPLVVWLVYKDKSKFVDAHGKEVVNFQLTMLIVNVCNIVLIMCLVGFLTLLATMIFSLVLHISGFAHASRGESFSLSFVYSLYSVSGAIHADCQRHSPAIHRLFRQEARPYFCAVVAGGAAR